MLKARMMFHLILIMIMGGALMKTVMSKVYTVGDSKGWAALINSNYAIWASSKKFHVGDTLLFHYNPTNHNVVQVNWHDFRSCDITKPLKTYETGNDSFIIRAPGHYFFTCSFPGHCERGQKLDVRVLKKYSLTTSSQTNGSSSSGMTTVGPPERTKMAQQSLASIATDLHCLLRCIVVLSLYSAMWVV